MTTHNTHNRQTFMPPVGFEPTISAVERPKTYALDRAATETGTRCTVRTSKYYNLLFQTWGAIIESYAMFETACVNEAKLRTGVLEWFESFREGHENLEDGPSSGQLSTDRKPTIVSKLHELVDTGRQITLKLEGGGITCTLTWRRFVSVLVKNSGTAI